MTASAKVMLLGDVGVGKTSLARRLVFDRFEHEYKTTIGVDVHTHDVTTPLGSLRMILWDTDGDFGASIFQTAYVRGASAAIIVCDASRPATIMKMVNLARRFTESLPGRPLLGIVNKIDLAASARIIVDDVPELGEIARTSALTGDGVVEAFVRLGDVVIRRGV